MQNNSVWERAWGLTRTVVEGPVVAPENVVYDITITNPDLGVDWRGTVDAQGLVAEHSSN